jgi:radical SAM superfamily enzyme YgiQ (UPF0313 family)
MQFGISYISSVLKSNGHKTKLVILTRETKKKFVDDTIRKFKPDLICFTTIATEYEFIAKTAEYIKSRYPSIYLLVGGPHVSLNPKNTINDSFDAVCIGEGEYATLHLIQQLEKGQNPTKINNLWIKQKTGIEINNTSEFIQDLDSLPFPDREMWRKLVTYPDKKQVVLLGRGCPFECTYCSNHALKRLASGKYVRFRSAENVIREMEELLKKFPKTEEIYFEVETIGVNMSFALELCSKLQEFNKKHKKISYGVNLRVIPGQEHTALFEAFKKANFKNINIGLESGSKRIRERVLNRYYSNEDIINTVKLAKKYCLEVYLFVIIGLPDETPTDYLKTVEVCRQCQPTHIYSGVFFPYPGTKLYDYCKKRKYLPKKLSTDMERQKAKLSFPKFSRHQIQKAYDWFNYDVYLGYRPRLTLLMDVVFRRLSANHLINLLNKKIHLTHLLREIMKK